MAFGKEEKLTEKAARLVELDALLTMYEHSGEIVDDVKDDIEQHEWGKG